jgi:Tfp pilus assembly protein FimT
MVELVVVMAIMLIVAAFAMPTILQMVHAARLRGTASDFTGLIQQARIRSVQDNLSYSIYVSAAAGATPSTGFLDLAQTGAIATGDPEMLLPAEVTLVAAANAPGTTNLSTQLLPVGTPTTVGPKDAAIVSGTPISFSPRGLPCLPTAGVCSGTVALSPTAYWAFFEDTQTTNWEAVTVSPAGRIQKWTYAASTAAWSKLY